MTVFDYIKGNHPSRSVFDLSYEKKFTCDMGQLIPVLCDEVVPGDFWEIGNQAMIRMQPLVAPVLHEVNMFVHYFYVPYRLLWDDWEDFITGGDDGEFTAEIPTFVPTNRNVNSLWDYLGFPVGINPAGANPIDFPRRAYNFVWNEYYRDQNLQDEVDITTGESILIRNWEKDYFTSSLPWQQRGTAPALPISGVTSAVFPSSLNVTGAGDVQVTSGGNFTVPGGTGANAYLNSALNNNTVDLSAATTFDIADLRLAFKVQQWLELNARGGARYTEFLQAHFGVSPRDERLDRPEYVGGSKSPVIFSEVLQTSSTDATSPQGNLAGHGIGVSDSYCGKYHVKEYGLIIGIMSIMPRSAYQQGIDRQWLRDNKFDFFFPEFVNLSEQVVTNAEICATNTESHNVGIFGYQGRFDEMRIKRNMVVGEMRDTFDYWHIGRKFDTASPPALNESFIQCVPDKRIFAAQDVPGFIVSFGNLIKAYRPLPIQAEPGKIEY